MEQLSRSDTYPIEETSSPISLETLVELDVEITDLEELLKIKKRERELVLDVLLKNGVKHQGNWSLVPNTRIRRTVQTDVLRIRHPQLYRRLAKVSVSVTDLEKALGEDNIKDLIITKTYTHYTTVYDPHGVEV